MRRVCAFPGCKSGTANDKRHNKSGGVRNKSLFKFPHQNFLLRKKWEEVIGRVAKNTEVLWELHSSREDILDKYETILSNGTKHIMQRGTVTLKSTAVPLVSNQDIPSVEHTTNVPLHDLSRNNSSPSPPTNIFDIFPYSMPPTTLGMMDTMGST
ncbi:uncharacterized protein [Fopius arisanus]|uniref:THAP-type domain-containing protein n=2 Tax=Fopius arisanus TaxID=64838 RepID=A0A9R1TI26_9HYME|nr:PREDICTED: uncharacterized protein LOC105270254 [Fopius arisanus]